MIWIVLDSIGGKNINLKINKIKKSIIIIFLLLINLNTSISTAGDQFFNQQFSLTDINNFIDIDITEVTDGIGLDITIKNNGDGAIENVLLEIKTDDNTLIIMKKQYEIPYLSIGDSTNIHISTIGFNIGLIKDYSKISLTLSYEDTIYIEGKISCIVIGPYISIISQYFNDDESFDGYILYCPMWSTSTYIIDKQGKVVHTWDNSIYQDSQSTYLLENGNLVRASLVATSSFIAGGYQGRVEIFDWNDTKIWNYEYSTEDYCSHHDVQPLPNGNILLIAWERFTRKEAINAGRNPNNLEGEYIWSDYIVEIQPQGDSGGNIVWEWHAWDHLIQEYDDSKENYGTIIEHPELININYGNRRTDWLHTNSIDYNPELDQILLSIHNFNEIWIIDHSTTIEEAASHLGGKYGKGGDLLYRWGNPIAYNAGTNNDQKYFGQHGANWVKPFYPGEGNIIVFNNDAGGSQRYSTIDEIIPPIDENGFYEYAAYQAYLPEEQSWIFNTPNPQYMYSMTTSNVLRLPSGNTLICASNKGLFLEVTIEKDVVWEYNNPYPFGFVNKGVARIQWYSEDYPGLKYLFD